jgi:hypothetical protein
MQVGIFYDTLCFPNKYLLGAECLMSYLIRDLPYRGKYVIINMNIINSLKLTRNYIQFRIA